MTHAILELAESAPDAQLLVLPVLRLDDALTISAPPGLPDLGPSLEATGFCGKIGETQKIAVPHEGGVRAAIALGLGDGSDEEQARRAGGALARAAGTSAVAIDADALEPAIRQAVLLGALLASYRFTAYKSELDDDALTTITVVTSDRDRAAAENARATTLANAVALVQDAVNTPPNDLPPAALADIALRVAHENGFESRVWDEQQLRDGGYGGLTAVGQGSSRGPRLVRLAYRPEGAELHIALVGKGITFDTGGLSLKPAASMVGMKFDMAGAATIIGVLQAAAELGIQVAVTGWLCIAENMPSSTATRPDDVVTIYGGKTVEITNTDAEGRIVMADGIAAASEEHPDLIIDIATLTGAQVVALGDRTTAVMGNDDAWIRSVVDASRSVGEPSWAMPIPEEVGDTLKSPVADLANMRSGNRSAGMLVAAAFLERFVGDRADGCGALPWVHLDIAGPSNNESAAYGYVPKGATGVMLRTLIALLESRA
ncbi:leucyl aminopeptidase [Pseudoclavibacter sp. RFBA6]|uniref:leucyl aminopeptidase n=1 Tax=Pseudoclavibacter sp. RFBA6 TaxID=2080573 RepID=UPI000CE9210D|nr:leucyl aminopeptidase [Pseudoclavibacter sp. RFBA6]PPG39239.1 leucyl aminopeptidase [Pseudoclavibacter sp. RFBA6]